MALIELFELMLTVFSSLTEQWVRYLSHIYSVKPTNRFDDWLHQFLRSIFEASQIAPFYASYSFVKY
jgi:hypothetical protein